MKLLVINPNTSSFVTERIATCAEHAGGPDVRVTAVTGRKGAPIVGTRAEAAIATVEAMDLAIEHAGDADAVLLGISFDSGLRELREILNIPVVGMSEAAMLAACAVSRRFALVTFGDRAAPLYDEMVDSYGLTKRYAGTFSMPPLSQDELQNPALIETTLAAKIDEVATIQGAESVVLGGAIFAGMADRLKDAAPVPVIDGIAAGVGLAGLLVGLGLRKPRLGSFCAPEPKSLVGMDPKMTRWFEQFGSRND